MYLIYYDYGVAYPSYLSLFSAASFFFFRRLSPVTEKMKASFVLL